MYLVAGVALAYVFEMFVVLTRWFRPNRLISLRLGSIYADGASVCVQATT